MYSLQFRYEGLKQAKNKSKQPIEFFLYMLAPGGCGNNFNPMTQSSSLGTRYENALMWMPQNLANEITLV